MQMAKAVLRRVAVALVFAGAATVSAYAQNIFGSIVGTVVDQSGAVLPKAAITVTNIATGEKRAVTSDASGNYQALSLPRGEYTIDIEASGFKHFSRSPIDVVVDQVARVDVAHVHRRPDPDGDCDRRAAHHADGQRLSGPGD